MTQETAKVVIDRLQGEAGYATGGEVDRLVFSGLDVHEMLNEIEQAIDTDKLSVEKLQEQLNTAKKALTEIAYTRQEIWRGGTLVGFEATEDAKIAYDALAAIGWDGCPVGLIVKNGLTKEEFEGSDDE
ncbi:hypothetical protein [Lactococcus cremoris]|uniref:hypothetical protein n=1 Tax=Lactococcus lactis subsp. cremoris TaxID=1359 RepID=UPI0021824D8C|nr:hypothetical protein [Lactococcus cremoris]WJQ76145.1 hypothetical protein LLNCDO700_13830 [Lactococcus cremoris]